MPGFLRLIGERLPSGRYRAADLLPPPRGTGALAGPETRADAAHPWPAPEPAA